MGTDRSKSNRIQVLAYLIAALTLGILVTYTIAKFTILPYAGFIFNPSDGNIDHILVDAAPGADVQIGDQLIQVGSVRWSDFEASRRLTLFDNVSEGQIVEITILRDGQEITIPWVYPGITQAEVLYRINSVLLLAYPFWIAGLASILLIRPRDARWLLMASFYFLTALWLASGSLSAWHVWGSAILQRMAIWMTVPVYLHFHWEFPKPLRRSPALMWGILYVGAGALAILEWLQIPPKSAYFLGFLLALLGSLILLVAHSLLQKEQRQDVRILAISALLAVLPVVALGLTGLQEAIPWFGGLAFLALPILPGAYFFTIYRHQVGGLRLRASRTIAIYIFLLLLGTLSAFLLPLTINSISNPNVIVVGILAFIAAAILAITLFPNFQRFFDERILGIPLAPTHILEAYSDRITTSLELNSLTQLLQKDILASLMIRQSALLQVDQEQQFKPLFAMQVREDQFPTTNALPDLLDMAEGYLPIPDDGLELTDWIRLILPLSVDEKLIGMWLLGERDPDDFYSQTEIDILKTIANQTAIALVNIEQAERLHALYQADIERHEQERSKLALELHDEVLNQFAGVSMKMDEKTAPDFDQEFQAVTSRLRQMIHGLRPAMLNYGLAPALEDLANELSLRIDNDTGVQADITRSGTRYDAMVEAHLYRIIQQACENALRHAQAGAIHIQGRCDPEDVRLIVADDGIGFSNPDQLDFNQLLASKHYGIAGMFERAALIGAELRIDSAPGEGTKVSVVWELDSSNDTPLAP